MTATIDESWARIENWLAEHAPQTYAALAPPADPVDIAELERVVGRPLLRPLVASLLRHDGVLDRAEGSLLPGHYRPISARGTAAAWHLLTAYHDACEAEERGEEVDHDFMKLGSSRILYGHPQLIPVARDLGGAYIVLDHRPGIDRGRLHAAEPVEGVMRVSHEKWASLPLLMEAVATSMETSQPLNGDVPVVDEERRLHWESVRLRADAPPPPRA
ncbi:MULTISPECIES: SMI1/KNR4 family protein [unclassified Streptomyces]|uniref:SMI1/KNR4 family protein n=1 Tax=unclassified Streptomyces TaxID=2593676 RepID=UPI0004BDA37C|nr:MULTISPECIES: SMI1/KNR4 family protein [unclassified Streptomyces]